MTTLSTNWKGNLYLRFPITHNRLTKEVGKCFEDVIKPIFDNLCMNDNPRLPIFKEALPEYGIEKGCFLLKANKKDWTNMRNLWKEKNFNDVYETLKRKSKPGSVITIVINKNPRESSVLSNIK